MIVVVNFNSIVVMRPHLSASEDTKDAVGERMEHTLAELSKVLVLYSGCIIPGSS